MSIGQVTCSFNKGDRAVQDWIRSESNMKKLSMGMFVKGILKMAMKAPADGSTVVGGINIASLTRAEITNMKEERLDELVLQWLEDPIVMKALPASAKATMINQRLPRVQALGQELDAAMVSLGSLLQDLPDERGVRAELVRMRIERDKAIAMCEVAETEVILLQERVAKVQSGAEKTGRSDDAYKIYQMFCVWREAICKALRGEDAADKARLLRRGAIDKLFNDQARKMAMSIIVKDGQRAVEYKADEYT